MACTPPGDSRTMAPSSELTPPPLDAALKASARLRQLDCFTRRADTVMQQPLQKLNSSMDIWHAKRQNRAAEAFQQGLELGLSSAVRRATVPVFYLKGFESGVKASEKLLTSFPLRLPAKLLTGIDGVAVRGASRLGAAIGAGTGEAWAEALARLLTTPCRASAAMLSWCARRCDIAVGMVGAIIGWAWAQFAARHEALRLTKIVGDDRASDIALWCLYEEAFAREDVSSLDRDTLLRLERSVAKDLAAARRGIHDAPALQTRHEEVASLINQQQNAAKMAELCTTVRELRTNSLVLRSCLADPQALRNWLLERPVAQPTLMRLQAGLDMVSHPIDGVDGDESAL